jgi:hypothetical protein
VQLTIERLRELLHYDPETGLWTRLTSPRYGLDAGTAAGSRAVSGHLTIQIDGRSYYAHRLAFFWMTGAWVPEVDHRDTDKANNRWSNLRAATRQQNNANKTVNRNNQLGLKGVSRFRSRFRARMMVDRKEIPLGVFDCPAAAHLAYCLGAARHFGEFARS